MAAITSFLTQARLSYRALFWWQSPWPFAANVLVRPLLMITLYALFGRFALGSEASEAFALGMTAFGITFIIGGGVLSSASQEPWNGTLSVLMSSAGSRLRMFMAWGVPYFPLGMIAGVLGVAATVAFVSPDVAGVNWWVVAIAMTLIALSGMAFFQFFIPLSIITADFGVVGAIGPGLMMTLSGALIPLDALPGFWQAVGHGIPVTGGLAAMKAAFDGASLSEVRWELVSELAVAAAYMAVGFALFRATEAHARRSGAFDRTPA